MGQVQSLHQVPLSSGKRKRSSQKKQTRSKKFSRTDSPSVVNHRSNKAVVDRPLWQRQEQRLTTLLRPTLQDLIDDEVKFDSLTDAEFFKLVYATWNKIQMHRPISIASDVDFKDKVLGSDDLIGLINSFSTNKPFFPALLGKKRLKTLHYNLAANHPVPLSIVLKSVRNKSQAYTHVQHVTKAKMDDLFLLNLIAKPLWSNLVVIEVSLFTERIRKISLDNKNENTSFPYEKMVFPSSLLELFIDDFFPDVLTPSMLPAGLKKLYIGVSLRNDLKDLSLLSKIKDLQDLYIGGCFNQSLSSFNFPSGLKKLTLSSWFEHPIPPGCLPEGLLTLKIGNCFNSLLQQGSLPSTLTTLQWEYDAVMNQPLLPGVLPVGLIHLELPEHFNQALQPGSLPKGLKTLIFNAAYNHPLTVNSLPRGLTSLTLPESYNKALTPGILPDGIEYFCLPRLFNQPLSPGSLPSNLKTLVIDGRFNHPLLQGVLPNNLEKLVIKAFSDFDKPIVFPPHLIELDFSTGFITHYQQELKTLPSSLKRLSLPCHYSHLLPNGLLPQSLAFLQLRMLHHYRLRHESLPSSLDMLVLHGASEIDLLEIPKNSSVKTLKLVQYRDFDPIPSRESLPKGLTTLIVNGKVF